MATWVSRISPSDLLVRFWLYNNIYVINEYLFEELACDMKFVRHIINLCLSIVLSCNWKRATFFVGGKDFPDYES